VSLRDIIISRIREHGRISAAEFIELALYHPELGYYASKPRRSGACGDFYTSVDIGPLFGEMIAAQLAEMWELLRCGRAEHFDLVEAGAGDGRLTRDVLDAAAREYPAFYDRIRVTLVERSASARQAQRIALSEHLDRVAACSAELPHGVTGIIIANELLDALPVHVVRLTNDGWREIHVTEVGGQLEEVEAPITDAAICAHLAASGPLPQPGWRGEVGLAASRWVRAAAESLDRGFILLFDYGHDTAELRSVIHANGTLMTYRRHTAGTADWLGSPGECDLTAHVDLTALRTAAEAAGLRTLGVVDQTYFMMALGITDRVRNGNDLPALSRRLAAKMLIVPGGLGSTIKVMAFGKGIGSPALRGFRGARLT
jgi:SAM-dependent MidA family methyltransferase